MAPNVSSDTLSIGVDIGGTKISVGLVTEAGEVLARQEERTGPDYGFAPVGEKVAGLVGVLLARRGLDWGEVRSVGFGLPGTTDSARGVVEFAPNLGWRKAPFGAFMRERLRADLYFVQETHAAVLAEHLFGAGKGLRHLACVAIGTGIGCGLMIDGRLYRGAFATAGEFGHLMVEKNGLVCACGRRGCVEAYGSGPALAKAFEDGSVPGAAGLSSEALFDLASRGREDIKRVIENRVEYIGMGLVNIANLLCPEKIILTGGLSEQEELVVEPLKAFVRNNAYALIADKLKVEKALLGRDAPMIGAAMLNRFIEPFTGRTEEYRP